MELPLWFMECGLHTCGTLLCKYHTSCTRPSSSTVDSISSTVCNYIYWLWVLYIPGLSEKITIQFEYLLKTNALEICAVVNCWFIEESWLWNCYEYLYLSLNRVRLFFRRMKTWNILPWWRGFWGHYRNIWCLELSKGLVTVTALHSKSYPPAFLCGMKFVYFYISTCSYSQPTCREILPEGCTVGLAGWCNFKRKHEGSVEIASSAGNDCTPSLYFLGSVSPLSKHSQWGI